MEDDVNQGGGGGEQNGRVNGAVGGRPTPSPAGGARPKQPSRPRPPPPTEESDDEPPSPAAARRVNGRPDPRLLLSHSASESDCALDECVYTYKGDRPADVNRNHHRPPAPPPPPAGGRVSPDLDFLEMDFDPSAFDTSEDELEVPAAAGWTAEDGSSPPPLANGPPPLESPSPPPPPPQHPPPPPLVADEAPLEVVSSPSPSPPSPAGSSRSSQSSGSRTPSPSPPSSRASSPGAAAAAAPAENVKFNRLSAAGSNSDDNLRYSDTGSPDSNAAEARPGRRPAEHKVTNRRLVRYNLSSSSAPAAPPAAAELPPRLPHSRSEHSAVDGGSDKYRHCCSNDLSDRQPGGCHDRLRRRENSVFNIPGGGGAGDPNLQHDGCHGAPEKAFMARKGAANAADSGLFENGCDLSEKVMIWTEMEAFTRQVTQIARSACGATAVINVLLALGYQPDPAAAAAAVSTRLRREAAPLADYLFSRSEAGCTHTQLIEGVETLSGGEVCGRFFCMYPRRSFQLVRWLAGWLRRGAVPVATLNLQRGVPPQQTVPDAWHHQMAFGVGPQGVYLTNPLECVSASLLGEQLSSDSVLLVRSEDVTARWRHGCSLQPLMTAEDPRWSNMNVLGQVVNVLREASDPPPPGVRRALAAHVTIPAWYRSGVTLFVRRSSPHCADLLREPELPRLEDC
ncbi:uncharacterized protein LOC122375723 [Amphibalanus amphitrite]|uniref:uncharacterized protein LOC122375723 n=1 Tax=Amphibalanus amphitrite TaxID=1232801 RepID=UPI001C9232BF|nr:uncharacterized protein LOC122375723 [Amphibalanus amphitrite]